MPKLFTVQCYYTIYNQKAICWLGANELTSRFEKSKSFLSFIRFPFLRILINVLFITPLQSVLCKTMHPVCFKSPKRCWPMSRLITQCEKHQLFTFSQNIYFCIKTQNRCVPVRSKPWKKNRSVTAWVWRGSKLLKM